MNKPLIIFRITVIYWRLELHAVDVNPQPVRPMDLTKARCTAGCCLMSHIDW